MNRGIVLLVAVLSSFTFLHKGRTDSNGGHYDRSSGEYHYHHGYSAHYHYDMNGDGIVDCPYNFKDNTSQNNNTSKSENKTNNFSESSKNSLKKQNSATTFGDVIRIIILVAIYSYVAFFVILLLVYWAVCVIGKLVEKRSKKFADFLGSDKFNKAISIVVAIISIVIALVITLR